MRTVLPRSLYVHVPFCSRRCAYCDFAVEAAREPPVEEWLDAVGAELRLLATAENWAEPLVLSTLYVGGGTPSLLGCGAMPRLRDRLAPAAHWSSATVEWTCEANPESFTRAVAEDWYRAGVNRISLGAQTFHSPSLRWMGRLHGADGPYEAVRGARRAGFDNISIDLIFGLPAELGRDWADDLDRLLAIDPDHVSLYGLSAEPATPLGRWVRQGKLVMCDEDRYAEEYLLAAERLTAAGFEHYEVSNFARPGCASRHNAAYWSGVPYAALGPGAHSYSPPVRRWNLREWSAYRDAVFAGRLPTADAETVEGDEGALERIWLALRTREGLSLASASADQRALAREWSRAGWAEAPHDRLALTARGWLRLDRLAVEYAASAGPAPPKGASFVPPGRSAEHDRMTSL